jgi:hypothetical protein
MDLVDHSVSQYSAKWRYGFPVPAEAAFLALTSISIFMRGSESPTAIIVAAGRASPK